jgi:DNA-binding transcriptional LysR family regulator
MDRIGEIRAFIRVVELGSFSRAASDLMVSQSTVTKHVAHLEKQLGVRLLNRNTRGIRLTELGALYYEKCSAALGQLLEAESIISAHRTQLEGVIRVSTSVAFGRRIVAPLLMEFMGLNPQLRIDLVCDDAFLDLITHGIDLALRMGRLADSTLGARYLGRNPWIMVASKDYLANKGEPTDPPELAIHDCIIYSSVQGDAVWHLRGSRGEMIAVVVQGRLRSNNLSTLLSAATAGLGIAILPRYVAEDALRRGLVRQIMNSFVLPEQELHAVFPSRQLMTTKVTSLIEFLVPRFREEWWLHEESPDCRVSTRALIPPRNN